MQLTEIIIDAKSAAKRGLWTPYAWHAFVWKFFTREKSRNFIFRLDAVDAGFRVYALSENPPENLESADFKMRTKQIPETFLDRKRYYFKIRLNPVRVVKAEKDGVPRKNGARKIVPKDRLRDWINEKFSNNGMRILEDSDDGLEISPIRIENISKANNAGAKIASVDVSGVLEVEDKDKFVNAFRNGIGREKTFGFGMLILK